MTVSFDGWRKNVYDGADEFLVVVKEQNKREQQSSQEEIHRKMGKASIYKPNSCGFHLNHSKKGRQTNQPTNIYIYIQYSLRSLALTCRPAKTLRSMPMHLLGLRTWKLGSRLRKTLQLPAALLATPRSKRPGGVNVLPWGRFQWFPTLIPSFRSVRSIYIYRNTYIQSIGTDMNDVSSIKLIA